MNDLFLKRIELGILGDSSLTQRFYFCDQSFVLLQERIASLLFVVGKHNESKNHECSHRRAKKVYSGNAEDIYFSWCSFHDSIRGASFLLQQAINQIIKAILSDGIYVTFFFTLG